MYVAAVVVEVVDVDVLVLVEVVDVDVLVVVVGAVVVLVEVDVLVVVVVLHASQLKNGVPHVAAANTEPVDIPK